jgi:hypothetical protein
MRTLFDTCAACGTALSLALLTAGCDRLRTATTASSSSETRYTLAKDTSGRTVRLDPVTGDVKPVDATQAPAAAPKPRISKRAPMRGAAVHPPAEAAPSAPMPSPVREVIQTAAVTVAQPEVTRVDFGELCAEPLDLFAVTLVDIGVYEEPSVGTLVQRLASGTFVTTSGVSGEWVRVHLQRAQGPLSGFVHCSALRRLKAADKRGSESYATEEF